MYDGTIIYVKLFGVFVDIGCHSDAFCHVLRVRGGYLESAKDALKAREMVTARVVEVNRKHKRLTVSLQLGARLEDERKLVKALMERKKRREGKRAAAVANAAAAGGNGAETLNRPDTSEVEPLSLNNTGEQTNENHAAAVVPAREKDPSQMTPAELKRARKIARRTERRAHKELTGLSA